MKVYKKLIKEQKEESITQKTQSTKMKLIAMSKSPSNGGRQGQIKEKRNTVTPGEKTQLTISEAARENRRGKEAKAERNREGPTGEILTEGMAMMEKGIEAGAGTEIRKWI